jgi:septal ring factor EnvC (AmiA/AmiB activator)
MTLEVETVVAVSLMMAVFSAVAAVGTSIVLGAGFERLRAGFDIVRKQTGFFSDAIHKLEQKVEVVDKQASDFSHSIHTLEGKVLNVGEQADLFVSTVQKLEQKVDIVDKQSGFFSDSLYKLEKQIETINAQEQLIAEKVERMADTSDLISAAGNASASSSLLVEMASLTGPAENYIQAGNTVCQETHFNIPDSLKNMEVKGMRFH